MRHGVPRVPLARVSPCGTHPARGAHVSVTPTAGAPAQDSTPSARSRVPPCGTHPARERCARERGTHSRSSCARQHAISKVKSPALRHTSSERRCARERGTHSRSSCARQHAISKVKSPALRHTSRMWCTCAYNTQQVVNKTARHQRACSATPCACLGLRLVNLIGWVVNRGVRQEARACCPAQQQRTSRRIHSGLNSCL